MKRAMLLTLVVFVAAAPTFAAGLRLRLGSEETVDVNGTDMVVFGYSVPSFVDWDNDGRNDLIVGEGSSSYPNAKVRVYLNTGTESAPSFEDSFYAQSGGSDLKCTGAGCLGCFPRVVYWDADARKDLVVGQADGKVKLFLNVGSDEDPNFDAGTLLQVGPTGSKSDIYIGSRATPCVVDWNSDGRKDLAVGAYDGKIHLFINEGTDTDPDFLVQTFAQANGSNLDIGTRSSPDVLDLDDDGKKDLLTGNTEGQLLFYSNTDADADPNFPAYIRVESDGNDIDLAGLPRSRPSVCDWTSDGYPDVLIGASDGKVHLYQSTPQPGDVDKDYDVDWDDFALLAMEWGNEDCGLCSGADLVDDDIVDMLDVAELSFYWLEGTTP